VLSHNGFSLGFMRRYEDAQASLQRSLALNPEFWDALSGEALVAAFRKGDTDRARKFLAQIRGDAGPEGSVTYVKFMVAMWDHHFDGALAALDGAPEHLHTNPGHDLVPRDLLRAQALDAAARSAAAHASWESAIRMLKSDRERRPDDRAVHAFLGRAYAGVGRREDAVREARRAVELLPVENDAFAGPTYLAELAKTYARLGDADDAIPLIRKLLAIPAGLTLSIP